MTARRAFPPALLLALLLPPAGQAATPAALPAPDRVTVVAAPRPIADFTLTDHDGHPRALSSLRGKPVLVFFGFTRCPDVCPAAMLKLKQLHEADGGALQPVRIVMISVDGERDTPMAMKKYLTALSPRFIGLTGKPRAVGNIAARFSAVAFKEQPDTAGNYGYYHSGQVFLLDASGRLRASFADATVADMATVTRAVLREAAAR